ncbi:MAG: DUF2834 domain-containing protein [Rhodobacteraceae bacterium]|nr:DUF2834 domain-containing protein [Paracoccaceae bacterium]
MSPLRMIYLALAIWGAVHPTIFMSQWALENGFDVFTLIEVWRATVASSAMFWDLLIASTTLSVFVLAEITVRRNWIGLIAIPATFLIGLGCGLPLYLFLRTRPVG